MERAVILSEGGLIGREAILIPEAPATDGGGQLSLEEMEKDYILRVFRAAGGNHSRTSQILGIDRKTLYLKLRKYGMDPAKGVF